MMLAKDMFPIESTKEVEPQGRDSSPPKKKRKLRSPSEESRHIPTGDRPPGAAPAGEVREVHKKMILEAGAKQMKKERMARRKMEKLSEEKAEVRKERVQGAPTAHEVQKEPTEAQQSDGSASAKSEEGFEKRRKGKSVPKVEKKEKFWKTQNQPSKSKQGDQTPAQKEWQQGEELDMGGKTQKYHEKPYQFLTKMPAPYTEESDAAGTPTTPGEPTSSEASKETETPQVGKETPKGAEEKGIVHITLGLVKEPQVGSATAAQERGAERQRQLEQYMRDDATLDRVMRKYEKKMKQARDMVKEMEETGYETLRAGFERAKLDNWKQVHTDKEAAGMTPSAVKISKRAAAAPSTTGISRCERRRQPRNTTAAEPEKGSHQEKLISRTARRTRQAPAVRNDLREVMEDYVTSILNHERLSNLAEAIERKSGKVSTGAMTKICRYLKKLGRVNFSIEKVWESSDSSIVWDTWGERVDHWYKQYISEPFLGRVTIDDHRVRVMKTETQGSRTGQLYTLRDEKLMLYQAIYEEIKRVKKELGVKMVGNATEMKELLDKVTQVPPERRIIQYTQRRSNLRVTLVLSEKSENEELAQKMSVVQLSAIYIRVYTTKSSVSIRCPQSST